MHLLAHLAPGHSQLQIRRFGTRCLIRCVIQPSSLNVSGGLEKHLFAGH